MKKEIEPRQAMLLSAFDYYGLLEIPGEQNNPTILKFFHEIGENWVQSESVAWCGAFINYLAIINGIERSEKLDARSWMRIGRNIPNPENGDIAIFWRESLASWKGHVGLYLGHSDDHIFCLGGNQDNAVSVKGYPVSRLLGFRRLTFSEIIIDE